MTIPIRSQAELLDAIRARRDELNISHETIDDISGLPKGYTSKLLANPPMKNLGHKSLGDLMGALGMALVAVPDPEQIARVEKRWVKRKRPQRLVPVSSSPGITEKQMVELQVTADLKRFCVRPAYMREIGLRGNLKRNERMSRWKKKVLARRAAKARWARVSESQPTP